jgi:hypothetical protein
MRTGMESSRAAQASEFRYPRDRTVFLCALAPEPLALPTPGRILFAAGNRYRPPAFPVALGDFSTGSPKYEGIRLLRRIAGFAILALRGEPWGCVSL